MNKSLVAGFFVFQISLETMKTRETLLTGPSESEGSMRPSSRPERGQEGSNVKKSKRKTRKRRRGSVESCTPGWRRSTGNTWNVPLVKKRRPSSGRKGAMRSAATPSSTTPPPTVSWDMMTFPGPHRVALSTR